MHTTSEINSTNRTPKIVGYWLLSGALIVLAMIVLGGYTRLSHSGLSIVSWKPITGMLPPLNDIEWNNEFEAYKKTPEFIYRNYHFTMAEFKSIFWPEYYHRLLGRAIALVFLIPFIFFLIKGYFKSKKLIKHLVVIFLLGILQGFVGWYMVKSGLVDMPAVSHIRLTIHLLTALTLYCYLIWVAVPIVFPNQFSKNNYNLKLKKISVVLLVILLIQIIYGGFVAGLKAGLVFPTFPKMGDEWIPELLSTEFDRSGFSALINSPFMVQFVHRWLAAILVIGIIFYTYKTIKYSTNQLIKNWAFIILSLVSIQFTLGVFTLLNLVPISLGVLHQFFAVMLLTGMLFSLSFMRKEA